MTEENKIAEEEKCKCFCHSKGFRKFLIVAGGTFVGVYLALCLFAALHRPPMQAPMGPMPCPCGCPQQQMARPVGQIGAMGPAGGPQHFERGQKGDFHKKPIPQKFDNKAPRPVQPEINE